MRKLLQVWANETLVFRRSLRKDWMAKAPDPPPSPILDPRAAEISRERTIIESKKDERGRGSMLYEIEPASSNIVSTEK